VIEQQARVIHVEDGVVRVRVGGQTGCSACDEGKGCGAGLFGKLLKRNPVELQLSNVIGASHGQAVRLGLPESLFMKLVFRLYAWPLFAGLTGMIAGHKLAESASASAGIVDLSALAGAILGVAVVLIFWQRASRPDISAGNIQLLENRAPGLVCGTGVSNNRFS